MYVQLQIETLVHVFENILEESLREIEHLSVYHDQHVLSVCVFLKDVQKTCATMALFPKDVIRLMKPKEGFFPKIKSTSFGKSAIVVQVF